jgi:hypothetical protein
VLSNIVVFVNFAGEEAFAERAEGDESDSEFFECGQHFFFGFAEPERVFALKRGYRLNRVRATDGLRCGFGEAKVFHFALLDEILHGAGCVFDRNFEVDAMLIVEIDRVDFESL